MNTRFIKEKKETESTDILKVFFLHLPFYNIKQWKY